MAETELTEQPARALKNIDFTKGVVPKDYEDVMRFAGLMHGAGLAPKSFDTPAKVAIGILTNMEMGRPIITGLQDLGIINGRCGIYGDGGLAMVTASGLMEEGYPKEMEKGTPFTKDWVFTCTVKRRKRPEKTGTWTWEDSIRAGFDSPKKRDGTKDQFSPWARFPKRMMQWKARNFVYKDEFGDVLKGLKFMEELEDYIEMVPTAKEKAKDLTEEIKTGTPTGEKVIYEVENSENPETVDPGPEGGHSTTDDNPPETEGKNILDIIKSLKPGRSDASKEGFIKFIGERLEAIYALPSEQLAYVKTKYLDATEAELPELPSDGNVGETLAGEPTIDEQIDIKTDETLSAYELTENGWLSQSDFRKIMMGYAKGMPIDDYNLLMGSYTDSTDVPPNKREEVLRRFVKDGLEEKE